MKKRTIFYWTQTGQQICLLVRRVDIMDVHRPNVCLWVQDPISVKAALSAEHRLYNRQIDDPVVDDEGMFYSPSGFLDELEGSAEDTKYVTVIKGIR